MFEEFSKLVREQNHLKICIPNEIIIIIIIIDYIDTSFSLTLSLLNVLDLGFTNT